MAEMLTYAPDLRALTGGQGDYTMDFVRYEEVPGAPGAEGHQRGPQRGGGGQRLAARPARLGAIATRKSISTSAPAVSCDVCGRTLLRGEQADVFLRRRHAAQRLRAVHAARVARGLDPRGPRRRHRALARAQRPLALVPGAPAPAPGRRRRRCTRSSSPSRPPRRVRRAPSRCPQQPRSVHAVPTNADMKMARALDLFNASAHPRTVAGVARSLGAPIVAARPSATEGSVVTIVVGWELSWYRFEVDLADEAAGPRITGQGTELAELDAADQVPNAAADEHGAVAPRRAARVESARTADDLLGRSRRDGARALRQARRVLQGRPQREGHHRPAQERAPRRAARSTAASTARSATAAARACRASSRRSTRPSEARRPRRRRRPRQSRARRPPRPCSRRPTARSSTRPRAAGRRRPTTSPSTAACCSGSRAPGSSAPTRSRSSTTQSSWPSRSTASTRSSTPTCARCTPRRWTALRGLRALERALGPAGAERRRRRARQPGARRGRRPMPLQVRKAVSCRYQEHVSLAESVPAPDHRLPGLTEPTSRGRSSRFIGDIVVDLGYADRASRSRPRSRSRARTAGAPARCSSSAAS